jgi:hypothetical protein
MKSAPEMMRRPATGMEKMGRIDWMRIMMMQPPDRPRVAAQASEDGGASRY